MIAGMQQGHGHVRRQMIKMPHDDVHKLHRRTLDLLACDPAKTLTQQQSELTLNFNPRVSSALVFPCLIMLLLLRQLFAVAAIALQRHDHYHGIGGTPQLQKQVQPIHVVLCAVRECMA